MFQNCYEKFLHISDFVCFKQTLSYYLLYKRQTYYRQGRWSNLIYTGGVFQQLCIPILCGCPYINITPSRRSQRPPLNNMPCVGPGEDAGR